jgi:hypothetical protein
MCDTPRKFIDDEYLPNDIQLREPSKMHFSDVRKLCDFLHHRQTLGKTILRFQYVLPQHQRGQLSKRLVVNHHPSDDKELSLPDEQVGRSITKGKMKHMPISTE